MTVHNHPPYRPVCNERSVDGQLRGACLNDDGSPAMSADPTAEHIDAVARSITVTSRDGNGRRVVSKDASLSVARLQARTLLASTDPAVHAAMLAALVRAGVLTEFRIDALLNEDGSLTTDAYIEHCNVVARQFVTSWEVAP